MTIWQPNIKGKTGPKYKRIAEAIAESIENGSLKEQDRLPPQRHLADQLGVSLNTISRAYAEASKRGYLCGEIGRGTYIRAGGPLPTQVSRASMSRSTDGAIDFSLSLPAAGEAAADLAQTLDDIKDSNSLADYLDYQTAEDISHHRDAASGWIAQLGLETCSDNIVLTIGAQHGLMASLLASMQPGDVLLTEAMTYAPVKAIAQHLGLKLFPVDMDDEGLAPEALEKACRHTAAKRLYCLPTLHTPTTLTMSVERRKRIAGIAKKNDLLIIEDDVFGFLPPDRPPPLASFASQHSIYITSVSKSLAPGLRVGYVYAPDGMCRSIRAAVNLSCWMPPPLMVEIASRWIEDGTAKRLNEFQRSEAQARQEMARTCLHKHEMLNNPFGFHLWLQLPAHWKADAFRVAAERLGVKLLTAEPFTVTQTNTPHAVRLCLSYELTRERVRRGLDVVAGLLEETRDPGVLVV